MKSVNSELKKSKQKSVESRQKKPYTKVPKENPDIPEKKKKKKKSKASTLFASNPSSSSSASSSNYPSLGMEFDDSSGLLSTSMGPSSVSSLFSTSVTGFALGPDPIFSGEPPSFYASFLDFTPYSRTLQADSFRAGDKELLTFSELPQTSTSSHSWSPSALLQPPVAEMSRCSLTSPVFTYFQAPEPTEPLDAISELAKALCEKYPHKQNHGEKLELEALKRLLIQEEPVFRPLESFYDLRDIGISIGYLSALSKDKQLQADPRFKSTIATLFTFTKTPEEYLQNIGKFSYHTDKQQECLIKDPRLPLIIESLWSVNLPPQEFVSQLFISTMRYAGRLIWRTTLEELTPVFETLKSAVEEIDKSFTAPRFSVPIFSENCEGGWKIISPAKYLLSYNGQKLTLDPLTLGAYQQPALSADAKFSPTSQFHKKPPMSLQNSQSSAPVPSSTLVPALISQGFITNKPSSQTQQETQKETQTPLGPPK